MPRKGGFRKRVGKRRFRKTRFTKRAGKKKFIPTVLPSGLTVRLKYVEWIDLTMGNGINGTTPAVFSFSTNSLHDPNTTGAGHQPMGYDQLSNIYQKYQVLGAKIKIRVQNGSTQSGALVGLFVTNSSTIGAQTVGNLLEQKASKAKIMLGPQGSGPNTGFSTHTWSLRKELKGVRGAGDDYSANVGASPSIQNYFMIWMGPMDAANTSGKVNIYAEVDYIVRWYDPIQLSQS